MIAPTAVTSQPVEAEMVPDKPAEPQQGVVLGKHGGTGLQGLASKLGNVSSIEIRQKVSALEAATMGAVEASNHYTIYAGTYEDNDVILEAHEQSECCNRCCCNPYHSLSVFVYDPVDGKVLLTVDRPGMECMLCCAPKPCLPMCAMMDCCLDGVNLYDGFVEGKPGHKSGGELISKIAVPVGAGGCTPTAVVDPDGENNSGTKEPSGYVEGPCIFGGCFELCFNSHFLYSSKKGKSGDIATITKLKPQDCCAIMRECCTDADRFRIDFDGSASAEQKADALSAAFLTDYMFFEQDMGLCRCKPKKEGGCDCIITLFLCACYGCLCPCEIIIPVRQKS